MDSVYWEILVAIRDQLRANVAFQGFGQVKPIPAENIVLRMPPPYGRRKDGSVSEVNRPGVVIMPGRTISVPSVGGAWNLDDVAYPIIIQVVDSEVSEYNEDRMRAWLKWLEQIRKYLTHGNLKLRVFEDKGHVDILYFPKLDTLDEGQFYIMGNCVAMLSVVAKSLEPRDVMGTN